MPRPVLAALFLLTAGSVLAQEGKVAPPAAQQDPEAAYQDLARALNKAVAEWQDEVRKSVKQAQAESKPIPAVAMTPPTKEFIERAQQLAAEYQGKDDAVRFLGFVCKNASREKAEVQKAVKTLLADHTASKAIGDVLQHLDMAAMRFGARDDVLAVLDAVVEKNPDAECKAQALLVRGSLRLQAAKTDGQRAAAKEDLLRVSQVTKDADLQKQAKDALFEIEHLQIGCKAPDIVAKDTEGLTFRLADYHGKVVLLDFWGFW